MFHEFIAKGMRELNSILVPWSSIESKVNSS